MSQRNKLEYKSVRRSHKMERPRPERRPASTIDLDSSAEVLCQVPKHGEGIGARGRRYLMRSRANLLVMPATPAKSAAVRLALKLESLTLVQLGRRRSQFAARAAGAKYKLAALSPDSRFRPPIQRMQDINLSALKQTNAEIEARYLHATNKLLSPRSNPCVETP